MALAAALALAARTTPAPDVWAEMARFRASLPAHASEWGQGDWRAGRRWLAEWLTDLLHDAGALVQASWYDPRLRVTPEADGLLSTTALILAREVGQGDRYTCDACGAPVDWDASGRVLRSDR